MIWGGGLQPPPINHPRGGGLWPPPPMIYGNLIIYPNHPPDGPKKSPADSPPDNRADKPPDSQKKAN